MDLVLFELATIELGNSVVQKKASNIMKILPLAIFLLLATFVTASGQVKPMPTASQTPPAIGARVLKNEVKPAEIPSTAAQSLKAHVKAENNETSRFSPTVAMTPAISKAATQIYRIGPLDVLDIQLVDNPTRESTLFTVLETGVLEFPLAGEPINVVGLTAVELAGVLRQRIKIFDNSKVVVNVRDFASHRVTISGLVASPGKKALRREAVPLYTLLAEALVLPEAARALITRHGRPPVLIDLKDPKQTATLITARDVIKVSGPPPAPTQFFFIGGAIDSPGQKPFHSGITLTQAILASGGTTASAADRVKVSRLRNNGRLISREYNLRKVRLGRAIDPVLKKGDRIEVFAAN